MMLDCPCLALQAQLVQKSVKEAHHEIWYVEVAGVCWFVLRACSSGPAYLFFLGIAPLSHNPTGSTAARDLEIQSQQKQKWNSSQTKFWI